MGIKAGVRLRGEQIQGSAISSLSIVSQCDNWLLLQHPVMTLMMKSCFFSLTILFLWRVENVAGDCNCHPVDVEDAFCNSDVVFSARVTGSQVLEPGTGNSGNVSIKYDIQINKVYKGHKLKFDAVYTPSSSASCGATLDTTDKEYLITGKLQDEKVHISRCDFIELDYDLSIGQRLKLFQCESFGCGC